MEKQECKICKIEKSLDSYYRCKNCIGGRLGICKLCKKKGLRVEKTNIHPFNQMWRKPEQSLFTLNRVTKEEYQLMWELLSQMGYDISKDVHEQFIEKVNRETHTPLKIKKRKQSAQARWLPNGELNPNMKNYKKNPPEE